MIYLICNVVELKYCLDIIVCATDPVHCFKYAVCNIYLVLFLHAEAGEGILDIVHATHGFNHQPTPPVFVVLILSPLPG